MHVIALLAAASAASHVPTTVDPADLLDADIVLHSSTSRQSLAIAWATASPYTHVGLVDRDGPRIRVVEAIHPVRSTPWATWVRRGRGGQVTVLRARDLDPAAREAVVARARSYLGRPYDLAFTPGDDRLYCSELVHLAFAAVGRPVGAWTPASELGLDTPAARALLEQRWRRHPACADAPSLAACMPALLRTPILTPASLRADPRLTLVASSFPAALR